MRVLIASVLATLTLTACVQAGEDVRPRLSIASSDPIVVAGTGFRPDERVRLLITPGPMTRKVSAGRLGRFRVALHMSMPRCGGFVVQAIGGKGSRAMLDRPSLDCAPVGP